ncbi:MAG: hypothetical protein AB2693_27550, partial [Candidatus Thiodiazotropha sp.]
MSSSFQNRWSFSYIIIEYNINICFYIFFLNVKSQNKTKPNGGMGSNTIGKTARDIDKRTQ